MSSLFFRVVAEAHRWTILWETSTQGEIILKKDSVFQPPTRDFLKSTLSRSTWIEFFLSEFLNCPSTRKNFHSRRRELIKKALPSSVTPSGYTLRCNPRIVLHRRVPSGTLSKVGPCLINPVSSLRSVREARRKKIAKSSLFHYTPKSGSARLQYITGALTHLREREKS